ncbi:hypothetical protein HU200_067266 [Digitaria exilis]|uniref:Uncharacterized protein n=1 Tax=Digitaria exilis TaxID=1010633 RepID=A0A834ZVW0_9POAL|nr:hypothetical protein HU200_067266 [Digitaria exilis]
MPPRAAFAERCLGCLCGAFVVAFVATVSLGGTAVMVFALVVLSRTPRRNGVTIAVVSVFFLVWLCFSAESCRVFFVCTGLGDRLAPVRRAALVCLRSVGWLLSLPCRQLTLIAGKEENQRVIQTLFE